MRILAPLIAVFYLMAFSPLHAVLVNRYSFNDPAGPAPANTIVVDATGSANGTVIGDGAVFTGTAINLPGGAGGTSFAAFVDLPNGILSTHNTVTFEAWYTVESSTNAWQRVWDFGSTAGGENNGQNVGSLEGQDYFMWAPMRGGNIDEQRNAVRNLDAASLGGGIGLVSGTENNTNPNLASVLDAQYHVASIWEDDGLGGGILSTYRDGVLVDGPTPTPYNSTDMNDVNNWLGRSNWTGDGYFDGDIDEFRIHDNALTAQQVSDSFNSGPDASFAPPGDADNDGIPDDYENMFAFLDPNDDTDAGMDEDMDGLSNLEEFNARTDPDDIDTDMDGLEDGDEIDTHGTDPLLADSDRDGLEDGDEVTVHNTDPTDPDSDGDGIPDGYETMFAFLDPNNDTDAGADQEPDGLTNLEEFTIGTEPDNEDTDSDDLTDGDEINVHASNPLSEDSDGDHLADGAEVNTHGTDPAVADSDLDGLNDGVEIAGGTDPANADANAPGLIHRYSFDAPAGPAAVGAPVVDSISAADGVIVGGGGNWTGTQLQLPGGAGDVADAAYVDLPNGLLSVHDHVTFEAWYTMNSSLNWGRIWDFGSSDGGEITMGMTGNTQGQDYFMFSPNRGTDLNTQRYTVRNLDPAGAGGMGPVDADEEPLDTNLVSNIGQEYHVAGVWSSDGAGGAQLVIYRDGLFEGSRTTTFGPKDINDVNNWLGRSNWTGDAYTNTDLNEFRIYDGAMNIQSAQDSFDAGADSAPGGADFRITEIIFNPESNKGLGEITLTWSSQNNRLYSVFWGTDLTNITNELDDGVVSGGESTSFGPFQTPMKGATRMFFRVTQNP